MKRWSKIAVGATLCVLVSAGSLGQQSDPSESHYSFTTPSRDGIGKRYFGREIARVMGHRRAAWLERRSRVSDEHPDAIVQEMDLAPNANVADIGAGTGYFVTGERDHGN